MSDAQYHMRRELTALASVKMARMTGCRKSHRHQGGTRGAPPINIRSRQPAQTPGHTELIIDLKDPIGLSRWQIVTSDVDEALAVCRRFAL